MGLVITLRIICWRVILPEGTIYDPMKCKTKIIIKLKTSKKKIFLFILRESNFLAAYIGLVVKVQ